MNKRPYTTPDGYFDFLQMRLSQIPEQQQVQETPQVRVSRWAKITPYFALVACFAFAIVAGRFILDKTVSQPEEDYVTLEQLYSADLLPYTSQYALFDEDYYYEGDDYSYEITEEDIINYLINTNVPLNYIGQTLYE